MINSDRKISTVYPNNYYSARSCKVRGIVSVRSVQCVMVPKKLLLLDVIGKLNFVAE